MIIIRSQERDAAGRYIEDGSQRDYMEKKCRIKQEMVFNMPLK